MANHASAEKRNRQRILRTERNRSIKSALRTVVKKARTTLAAGSSTPEAINDAIVKAAQAVDRAASKGAVHPKAAARTKSRLAKAAHKATARPS